MDRTASAWIGVGSLVVCGLGFAWNPCSADPGAPTSASRPGLLKAELHSDASWKPLVAAPPRATINPVATAATHRPPASAAQTPTLAKPRNRQQVLDAAKLSSTNPVRPPVVEAAEPLADELEAEDLVEPGVVAVDPSADEIVAEQQEDTQVAQIRPVPIPLPPTAQKPAPAPVPAPPQDETQTLLPWAHANPRSAEMKAVMQRVNSRLRNGFLLAKRSATYSARSEFTAALKMIAEANDDQQNTRHYTTALQNGLTALRESNVFLDHPADRAGLSVERIVAGHKTTLLKDEDTSAISPLEAVKRYGAYAQEQLAAAAAQEPLGSMALFGMAKAATAMTTSTTMKPQQRTAQAITLYRAALLTAPKNFLAANELAVLEVKNGNLREARDLLIASAAESNQPATWHNLMTIHSRLGEVELAKKAQERLSVVPKPKTPQGLPQVEWLDANSFAQTTPATEGLVAPPPPNAPSTLPSAPQPNAAAPAARPRENVAKQGVSDWLPWNSRRK